MKTLSTLNTNRESYFQKIENLSNEINTMVNDLSPSEKITAEVHFNHDGIFVSISHELNWTNFIDIFFQRRHGEGDYTFRYSHGSGGFNDAPQMDILEAELGMLEFTRTLDGVKSKFVELIEKFNKLSYKVGVVCEEIKEIEKQNQFNETQKIIDATTTPFTLNKFLERIDAGNVINIKVNRTTFVNSDILYKKGNLYYLNDSRVSKKSLKEYLGNTVYVSEDV